MIRKIRETKVIGGIGEKKSNGGSQYFLQDRIYEGDVAITILTNCNPYYRLRERESKMLKIRKLTPLECCRLMGADDSVDEKLKKAGLSDSQRYHIYGDGLVTTIPQKIFERMK